MVHYCSLYLSAPVSGLSGWVAAARAWHPPAPRCGLRLRAPACAAAAAQSRLASTLISLALERLSRLHGRPLVRSVTAPQFCLATSTLQYTRRGYSRMTTAV